MSPEPREWNIEHVGSKDNAHFWMVTQGRKKVETPARNLQLDEAGKWKQSFDYFLEITEPLDMLGLLHEECLPPTKPVYFWHGLKLEARNCVKFHNIHRVDPRATTLRPTNRELMLATFASKASAHFGRLVTDWMVRWLTTIAVLVMFEVEVARPGTCARTRYPIQAPRWHDAVFGEVMWSRLMRGSWRPTNWLIDPPTEPPPFVCWETKKSRRENTSNTSVFYIHNRSKDSNDNSEYYPLSPRFYDQHDTPYFTFTSQGEILSDPHRFAAGLLSPLNPMDPGVEMPSWNELSYTIDVLPECNGSFTSDILADFYANLYGVHEGAVVQGHDRLTIHQLLEISYGRDMASRLNPSDVAANFYSSYSELSAVIGVGSSSLPTSGQGTFGTEPLQEHLCTIDKVTSPVLRASAPSTTSSTYEASSHLWNVDQDSRTLTAAFPTGYPGILQGAPRPNSSMIRSGIHTPYSAHIAHSSPNGNLPETNPHQNVCGWRLRDGSICGGAITRRTVPEHLAVHHRIKKIASYQLIACRWCPDGSDLIKRESIVRHVRKYTCVSGAALLFDPSRRLSLLTNNRVPSFTIPRIWS
ncbi:hypothetical protein BU15DRAFT_67668 [Melanogaster broomeanus]|nr:hypothetical protein BU15DRAFT_67668 [Melanogaster broomeanus]